MSCIVKAMVFPVIIYGCEENWTIKKLKTEELMLSNCGAGEDSWESLRLQGNQTSQSQKKLVLNIHWKDWCWSWSSNTWATWWEEPIHWKRPWCWERLKAGKEETTEHEVVGWHHWLNGLEFEQAPGDSGGQGSLLCCSPWACRVGHYWVDWTRTGKLCGHLL